ncbi:FtsK/SpoIIIE domain-containing protein [Catenuloplanes atrovinosus]|uniref:S-DNA-T family DNA segregation ATPase FtsK/SpoIIIE n=1 Tax=Catenuloplanes atrovinosus TaxID=137266 RepID=A0AAE4CD47_9ACTN|nr:FtsK/SpoIIIE domain-containing protein [Catenuloplanes atrovinosus]MDR7278684.1 S-DNA-T family DNA segregation ATPase FtsK/SpoIIIE [Catenuloplanes atrovinosus]
MPLINVIPGDKIPTAPMNVRVPVWRVPGWLLVLWWTLRGAFRATVLAVRFWWLTGPAALVAWIWADFGWQTLLVVLATLAAAGIAWWRWHRASWWRFVWWPLLGRWRRLFVYRRGWAPAMATCGLATTFGGDKYVPQLVKVRATAVGDELTVRMLPGQHPDDWGKAAPRLAYTFRVRDGRARTHRRPDRIVLVFLRRDPLATTIAPLPVPTSLDLERLPLGVQENGDPYALRLAGSHVLVGGATNAGKGSVIWALIAALAGGIQQRLVELWVFDPKGGMELAGGLPLFTRFVYDTAETMAGALEDAVVRMRARANRLRGVTRQHTPTPGDSLIVIVIDELAALTSYISDRKVRDRIRESLSLLLSQGRAVGVHVIAALQDPRKEVLPFRDLFPTRIALRLTEAEQVDLILGDGARNRGALADEIPETSPGVAYVALDGVREPVRVRFAYHSDSDIQDLCRRYGYAQVVEGEIVEGER